MKNELVVMDKWVNKHNISVDAVKELKVLQHQHRRMTVKHFLDSLDKDGIDFDGASVRFTTPMGPLNSHTKSLRYYFEEHIDDYRYDDYGSTVFPYDEMKECFKMWLVSCIENDKSVTINNI